MGEVKQRLLRQAAQRAAQEDRQCHIIGRIERHIHGGQHIGHRQLLQQHHAVGPGNIDIAPFQRARQFGHKTVARAHQHQNIPGADILGLIGQQGGNFFGNLAGQSTAPAARGSFGDLPCFEARILARCLQGRPKLDMADGGLTLGLVAHRTIIGGDALAHLLIGKHAINGGQYLRCRAPRNNHRHIGKLPANRRHRLLEILSLAVKTERVCSLKTED